MKVTFDSNTWRKIASPEIFPNDPDIEAFKSIRQSIIGKKITPCLSETVFTLEGIPRKQRKQFISDYKMRVEVSENENEDGSYGFSITLSPNKTAHPGNNPYLDRHLAKALTLGFRILKCPRIGGITNPDIEDYFLDQTNDELKDNLEMLGELLIEIENKGAGMKLIKNIGDRYKGAAPNWQEGIKNAPENENGNIASAISEWADGDSVASHIAYKNSYFCTRDLAKKAGRQSIFSTTNRQWFVTNYNIRFATPNELSDIIALNS